MSVERPATSPRLESLNKEKGKQRQEGQTQKAMWRKIQPSHAVLQGHSSQTLKNLGIAKIHCKPLDPTSYSHSPLYHNTMKSPDSWTEISQILQNS